MEDTMKKTVLLVVLVSSAILFAGPVWSADYVGSDQCFSCHQEQYNYWQASGHPWKLRKAEKARYSKLPLPPGYSWDDISYVIGGAVKKARFIDQEGFIITSAKDGSEAKTQYNIEDGSWSFYHKGEKKPYQCGPCHMTAYSPDGNQDGRPGMIGTWLEDGITCEECHGPGSDHIRKPAKVNVIINTSAEACGKCHQRGGIPSAPPAKGGFIRHHEQINELRVGPHAEMDCLQCHDPHQRAILTEPNCGDCHDEILQKFAKDVHARAGRECIDCHMPRVTKSAIKLNSYTADVRTHIFKINTDPNADMFRVVEEKGKKSTFAKGFVTVDFVCLGCHGSRDKAWAAQYSKEIHK